MSGPDLCLLGPMGSMYSKETVVIKQNFTFCSLSGFKSSVDRKYFVPLHFFSVSYGSFLCRVGTRGGSATIPAAASTEGTYYEWKHEQGFASECCHLEETLWVSESGSSYITFLNLGFLYIIEVVGPPSNQPMGVVHYLLHTVGKSNLSLTNCRAKALHFLPVSLPPPSSGMSFHLWVYPRDQFICGGEECWILLQFCHILLQCYLIFPWRGRKIWEKSSIITYTERGILPFHHWQAIVQHVLGKPAYFVLYFSKPESATISISVQGTHHFPRRTKSKRQRCERKSLCLFSHSFRFYLKTWHMLAFIKYNVY